ncbi:MAG: hypothetical protein Q8P46_16530 [Hyphomicrobiales bacterium]|nr:hypothetical protein [Hyphomicrobiales bacterium]
MPAAADAFLEGLVGEWIGRGNGVRHPGAPLEKVYCRITNVSAENGAVLKQEGRCAFGNETGALSGHIRALGDGRYDGTMNSPVMQGAASISGASDGKRLLLDAGYEDTITGRPARSYITLSLVAEGEYRMLTTATDAATGEPMQSSEILFRRKQP